ncbi:MAG: IS66 family transposase [Lentisphaerae bacterium]|nr:IS66 family transposase [Lentisphaerota bacterium]
MKDETITLSKEEYGKLLELARLLAVLVTENGRLVSENERLGAENKLLRDKVDLLIRRVFGSSSEKLDSNQMLLELGAGEEPGFDEEPAAGEDAVPAPRKKRTAKRDRLPDDLPEERTVIDPPEVTACPEEWRLIGSEETVKLDVEPMRFKKVVIERRKYVRRAGGGAPIVAPAPEQLIPGSFASASLLAHINTGKFADHQPLYRQEQIYAREGILLSRKTMCVWVWRTANWLRVIYEQLRLEVLEADYLQVDETPVGYICPGHGKTKKGYLWVYLAPGRGVYFEWHAGRGAKCLEDMLGCFDGTVQTDGYIAYESHNKARPEGGKLKLGNCWAHARRGFHKAQDESALAKAVLTDIQSLYRVEAELRESGADAQQREARRRAESAPMLTALKSKLEAQRPHHLPQSLTGKAISYALDRWEGLTMYVGNGEMEIDNNLVENAIRPSAIGKKNWLFFGSESGGWQNAVMYTVVQNCKMHGINPEEYLKDVLSRLPHIKADEARKLTPAKWLAARTSASRIA